ncbi:hypothetical protein AAP_04806 [Ascosphaera apis ARSEF 7405]|uniref:Protein-S-isoprenylcysteine O-methyltransferase n=1 Tax=Ascosphaera apis ARSEF 7405 TaxID=392613 RepID=A0A167WDK8_9EURO|nr:hypothetical protein AAP_04806 [Ascosphaera apis ARSEF 7405]
MSESDHITANTTAPITPIKVTREWVSNTHRSSSSSLNPETIILDKETLPGGDKSLSGISLRAFLLGQTCALGIFTSICLAYPLHSSLWRAPTFISCLALFHFLEFFITARYNPPAVSIASFLLDNGSEYTIAHLSAMLECLISRLLFGETYFSTTSLLFGGVYMQTSIGVLLIIIGQLARSKAMVDAGTNFNHQVQTERQEGHELVREEKALVTFFGSDYVKYRERTMVGIPGIS